MNELLNSSYAIYFISFLAFLAAILLIEGAYMFWSSLHIETSLKTGRRLRALSAGGMKTKEAVSLLATKQLSSVDWLNRFLTRIPRMHALDRLLEQAGMEMTVTRFIITQVGLSIVFSALFIFTLNFTLWMALPMGIVAGFAIPALAISRKQTNRKELFTKQLPDTLDYIARSLRAGNPFSAAINAVAKEMPAPTSTEFAITFDELNYGLDLDTALHNLGERTGSEEIRYFITAVLIQRQTGGNLADVLNRISAVMRSRITTRREIKVLSAEMTASANVLIALPFFVAGSLLIVNPDYLSILIEHELGFALIGVQILLMALGYGVVQRMVKFHV